MNNNIDYSKIERIIKTSNTESINNHLEDGWVVLEICKRVDIIGYVDNKPVLDEYSEITLGKLRLSVAQQYFKNKEITTEDILKNSNMK